MPPLSHAPKRRPEDLHIHHFSDTGNPMIDIATSDLDFSPIHERMQFYVDENILSCCNTLVMRGLEVLDFKTYGYMDLESKRPLTDDAIFRVYSNTKLVTSVAAMMLYEEGKFALDDPLAKHLPVLANLKVLRGDADSIAAVEPLRMEPTIAQLMSHSAGFSYGWMDPTSLIDQAYTQAGLSGLTNSLDSLENLVEQIADLPLADQPGTRWRYSFSTDILARLVEVWSGERFGAFLKRRIIEPLGMVDTDFFVPEEKRDRFTAMYAPTDPMQPMQGGLVKVDDPFETSFGSPPDFEAGGHGLVSTVADYLSFVRVLANQGEWNGVRLLQPETLALMRINQLPPEALVRFMTMELPRTTFGLGFALKESLADDEPPGALGEHYWGGVAGTHSYIAPVANLALMCFTQRMPGFLHPFSADFKRLAYEITGQD
jgi:CubicO group peptidase (beta-lactamase class C family)